LGIGLAVPPAIFIGAHKNFYGFDMYTGANRRRFFARNYKVTVILWFRATIRDDLRTSNGSGPDDLRVPHMTFFKDPVSLLP
jgi:hypothetical protein